MKKIYLLLILMIAGCGGGGDTPSASSTIPNSPPTSLSATTIYTQPVNINTSGGDYLISVPSGSTVTVSGDTNTVELMSGQALSLLEISGNSNMFIIRQNSSSTALRVTGSSNIIWIPTGIQFNIDNTPHPDVTVVSYTP